jgi:small subunit ribosomal protein S31
MYVYSELFEGMSVDKTKSENLPPPQHESSSSASDSLSRARQVRKVMRDRPGTDNRDQNQRRKQRSAEEVAGLSYRPIDIFGAQPLGIFTKGKPSSATPTAPISYLKTWDALFQKDLKLQSTHPPANGFEEMVLWTEQGKMWHYPINNEQGN